MRILFIRNSCTLMSHSQLGYGMGIVATIAHAAGHEVKAIDNNTLYKFYKNKDFFKIIKSYKPDIIAYGLTLHNAYETYQQISKLKIKFKNITIIAGGIHMRHCFDEALRHGVDVVVNREGEKVIVPLLEHLERHGEDYKNDLDLIAGVSFVRQDGRFHFSKEYPAVENLDDVPVVNYELFNIQDFIKTGTEAGLFYFTGQRGCPFKCTFCSDAVHNLDKRCSSADWLFKNVRYLHEKYQVSYLLIADNNFTFPRKRAVEFCRKMIDSGLSKKLTFSCQTNTRFPLDEELVCLMREAGFCRINFGLERLTTYSLQKINKMQPFQGVHDALTLVSKHNIDPSIFMMIGFPFETEELLEQEKELFLDLKKYTHRLFLSVLCPMPGTMYYDGSPKIKEWYLNRDAYLMFRAYFTNVLDMHTFNTIERNFFNLSKPVQHALKNYYLLFKKITHGSVFNKKTPLLSLCLNLDFLVAKISQACFYFSPSLEFFIFNHIKSLRYYAGNYFLSGYMLKKNLVADE